MYRTAVAAARSESCRNALVALAQRRRRPRSILLQMTAITRSPKKACKQPENTCKTSFPFKWKLKRNLNDIIVVRIVFVSSRKRTSVDNVMDVRTYGHDWFLVTRRRAELGRETRIFNMVFDSIGFLGTFWRVVVARTQRRKNGAGRWVVLQSQLSVVLELITYCNANEHSFRRFLQTTGAAVHSRHYRRRKK